VLSALFMIRDCTFLDTVTDKEDKSAYVDEWEIIAPRKLDVLKKRVKDKFKQVLDFVKFLVSCYLEQLHCCCHVHCCILVIQK